MKNTKRSITFKVVIGYISLTALAIYAIWFIYGQIVSISENTETSNVNNQKLFLITEAATNLYITEGLSRDIIQNQNPDELPKFNAQIETINGIVDSLIVLTNEEVTIDGLYKMKDLLNEKTQNLEELLLLRKQGTTESYYSKVINKLQHLDDSFEDQDYERQLSDLEPPVRRAVINLIDYSRKNNEQQLTQKTADSLVVSLKTVLNDLETQERRIMFSINQKENELLENDRIISNQLRDLRTEIEMEEVNKSLAQVETSKQLLEQTSVIIGGVGILSVLTILLFVILIIRDTNKSQKYRTSLESSKNYTEALLKSRELIMATVTHDLRSPLNTVIGYSDLLNRTGLNNKQKHYLNNLKISSDYILRLVNDLLDLTKLEAGKLKIEKMRFRLRQVIDDSLKNVIPAEDSKHLEININISEDLDKEIISDPFRLQQILINLISNAYKFTEKGKITIDAELKKINKNPNTLKIKITDTGIGISKKEQSTVFDEFSQAIDGKDKKHKGFGLGLAISQKLVQLLGGEIYLESIPGKGSAFTFYFPIEKPQPLVYELRKLGEPIEIPAAKDKKILIVDDETGQLALTGEVVKIAGIPYISAKNVDEALDVLKTNNIDLILTDIQMPGRDGFDFLEILKSNSKYKNIPVAALSGRMDFTEEMYLEKGFSASLLKPYQPNDLFHILNRFLSSEVPLKTIAPSPLENGNMYNLDDLYLFTEGDQKSFEIVINAFIQSTAQHLTEVEKAALNNNYAEIENLAHKMLPMFRQLKISEGVIILEKLEKIPDTNNQEILIKNIQKLKEISDLVLDKLQAEVIN